jgi:uncharacterized membrane protein YccF (DUF307 family)
MKTIGNVLWLIFVGIGTALGWLLWALLLAITVVGIPFARQCLKLANFSLWPFGRMAVPDPTATRLGILGAILWFVPGLFMAAGYVLGGVALCITVIGIPFGIQSFKLAGLSLAPFGKKIVPRTTTA